MTEEIQDNEPNSEFTEIIHKQEEANAPGEDPAVEELKLLKQRADVMGIKYSSQIGIKKLKIKIEEGKKEADNKKRRERTAAKKAAASPAVLDKVFAPHSTVADQIQTYDEIANGIASRTKAQANIELHSKNNHRMVVHKRANKLVRIRVTCMNPNKSKLPGEIFSVGNSTIGFLKKFVPFNAENGWHVPQIILTQIQNRKFTTFYEVDIKGKKHKRHRLIPEFAVEIMKPLTGTELRELAQRQRMASGADEQK